MASFSKIAVRAAAILVPLALGGAAIFLFKAGKVEPQPKEAQVRTVPVRVLTLKPVTLTPRVTGYGTVSPALEWRAIARLEGEVTWTSEQLANGNLVEAGTELMRIDDSAIRLQLAQIDAQQAALSVKDETLNASLAISRQDLELSEAQLKRQSELSQRGVGTAAAAEQAQRQALSARSAVRNLENQLALNAAERDVLTAQRAIAARDLEHATIRAPFGLRVGTVQSEVGQYVTRGQQLFAAEGVERMEVAAQLPIGRMQPLMRSGAVADGPLGLKATVRLRAPGHDIEWPAKVDRVGDVVDQRTQSSSIIVSVEQPVAQAKPGEKPPLRKGMFVEVELGTTPREALAVPAEAVQGGTALVVGVGGKLETREVAVDFEMGGLAVVSSGLEAGMKLVVSDPAVAVAGMNAKPVEDEKLKARIAAEAAGSAGKAGQ